MCLDIYGSDSKISFPFLPFLSCIQMLGKLKQLVYLDVSKNNLELVDEQICGCESLQDLLLSNNALTQLPGSIGKHPSTDDLYWKSLTMTMISVLFIIMNDCTVVCIRH